MGMFDFLTNRKTTTSDLSQGRAEQNKRRTSKNAAKPKGQKDTKPPEQVEEKTPPNFKAQDSKPVGKGFNLRKAGQEAKALGKKADKVKADSKKVVADKPATPTTPPPKAKSDQTPSDFRQYKSMAAAKKAGSLYYEKNGKKMAAVSKEDLAPGQSLRDYMNEKTNKKRKGKFITPNKGEMNMKKSGKTKLMGGGMTKAAYQAGGKLNMVKGKDGKMVPDYAADGVGKMNKGGGVKKMNMGGSPRSTPRNPTPRQDPPMGKRLLERPNTAPNVVAGPRGPKKMNMGGMAGMGAPTMMKEGGTAKKTKVRGAGIARKGVRPAKMR